MSGSISEPQPCVLAGSGCRLLDLVDPMTTEAGSISSAPLESALFASPDRPHRVVILSSSFHR